MSFPVLDLTRAPPGKLTMPYVVGGAVEGGRSISGLATVADATGGGLVMVKYTSISLGNTRADGLRYWSKLGAMLNSGVRSILVPLLTDFIAPSALAGGGSFSASAALNAGTISINVSAEFITDDTLSGGEWFEVQHATMSSRSYVISDVDSTIQNADGSFSYTVGIRPPLREAVGGGTPINFNRPRCLMRLAPGTSITADVSQFWWATPDVSFIESFGST